MISSYPDYFATMPMMPRGIPVMPGYPVGNIERPVKCMDGTDEETDEKEQDIEYDEDSNKDKRENDIKDTDNIDAYQNLARQQTGTTGTTGTTGSSTFEMAPGSPVEQDINFTQGYLRTQIGKRVRVTYLLGTGTLQDRTGILTKVGISYIILRNEETNTDELSDIYSIKFVVIFD